MAHVTRMHLAVLLHWPENQQCLAIRCGIDNSTMTKYIRGTKPISSTHRAILAHVLKVAPLDLDGWIGPELWEQIAG